jgi:hypothetical protein
LAEILWDSTVKTWPTKAANTPNLLNHNPSKPPADRLEIKTGHPFFVLMGRLCSKNSLGNASGKSKQEAGKPGDKAASSALLLVSRFPGFLPLLFATGFSRWLDH